MDYTNKTEDCLAFMKEEQQRTGKVWYAASPYSHPNKWIHHKRALQAAVFAGWLLQNGVYCIAPIPHSHYIAEVCELPTGFEFWEQYDLHLVAGSCGVIVLAARGYLESTGVSREASACSAANKPLLLGVRRDLAEPAFRVCGPVIYDGRHYWQKNGGDCVSTRI